VVIGGGDIITALARALGYAARVDALSILYRPDRIDLLTYINMKLFKAINGGQLWLNHHGRAPFSRLNQAKTTITRPSNLIYHDDVDGESGVNQMAVLLMMGVMMMMMSTRPPENMVVGGGLL